MQLLTNTLIPQNQFLTSEQRQMTGAHKGIPMFIQRSVAFVALAMLSPLLLISDGAYSFRE